METTERFPQGFGNLAGEREIPTFPQRILFFGQEDEKNKNTTNDGSDPSSDQLAGGESHPRPHWQPARIIVANRQK
jgi:hypothetical protein